MSKFDYALYLLEEESRHNEEINILPATDNIQELQNDIVLGKRNELRAAIRVLEAAGNWTGDDKERVANALDNLPFYTPIADYKCPGQVLRDKFKALLAALPDKEKL